MSPFNAVLLYALVVTVLAIIAWASAWKTLEWLGDAEDLLEEAEQTIYEEWGSSPADGYRRRTPRRST